MFCSVNYSFVTASMVISHSSQTIWMFLRLALIYFLIHIKKNLVKFIDFKLWQVVQIFLWFSHRFNSRWPTAQLSARPLAPPQWSPSRLPSALPPPSPLRSRTRPWLLLPCRGWPGPFRGSRLCSWTLLSWPRDCNLFWSKTRYVLQ